MQKKIIVLFICTILHAIPSLVWAESEQSTKTNNKEQTEVEHSNSSVEMLTSLLDLQLNIKEQIQLTQKKLKKSKSETERKILKEEIAQLDRQSSETTNDFERIATGVEPALFAEKKPATFSWKEELGSLVEPAIKELKRFTIRARQKSDLKDKIVELRLLETTALQAAEHLSSVLTQTTDNKVHREVKALQPEWQNIEKRLANKLGLAERELAQLEEQEFSLVESSSNSLKIFFKNRGLYLALAITVFFTILLACRMLYRVVALLSYKISSKKDELSLKTRLLYLIFQVLSIVLAIIGLFFVLYLAEDWFLLSMAIIFFVGFAWTIRQGLPKLWQQGRLMLNIGSVRENERLILYGVPWRVASINVFCKLVNPHLEVELRLPIEDVVPLVSRPYKKEEPWFPCKKDDWIVVGSAKRAKVVSLSHEQIEVVERGGKRITYPTDVFLQACPVNLSQNFRVRVPFGVSYELQGIVTSTIPEIIKAYIEAQMIEADYSKHCLNLQVEFFQANASSLDLIILADFKGEVADICKRLERAIQKWCVDCCTDNNWEIPFPQLTVHKAEQ